MSNGMEPSGERSSFLRAKGRRMEGVKVTSKEVEKKSGVHGGVLFPVMGGEGRNSALSVQLGVLARAI